MAKTYTVKWGDTLYDIAIEHNTTYQTLAKINGLPITKKNGRDYVLLTVGQVIKLTDDGKTAAKVTTGKVSIKTFGLQSTTDRGMYVTWAWDRANTKEYSVEWSEYYDGYWHYTTNTTTNKYNEFTAQTQATSVRVRVKPISKTYTNSKNKEVAYWTNVVWTGRSTYSFSNNPPKTPGVPSVDIAEDKLTASLENLASLNASIIEFQLAKNGTPLSNSKKIKIDKTSAARAEIKIELGSKYKVRARAWKSEKTSSWSAWSGESATEPSKPVIDKCMAGADDKSIELTWESVPSATGYVIEYATHVDYFGDKYGQDGQPYKITLSGDDPRIKNCAAVISENIVSGNNIFVRVRATNDIGESDWSEYSKTSMDNGPLAPTSFTDKGTYSVGEVVTLKWIHNQRVDTDTTNSSSSNTTKVYAKYSHIDLYVDDGTGSGFVRKPIATQKHLKDDGTTVEKIDEHAYSIYIAGSVDESNESDYDMVCPKGCLIKWRVRTAAEDGVFGEWSALRTVAVYTQPTLELHDSGGNTLTSNSTVTLKTFPLEIEAFTGPDTQTPIGYHVEVTANKAHDIIDNYGETVWVEEGDVIYSKSFDDVSKNQFSISLTAGDIALTNDQSYTLTCTVSMNSGLSVTSSFTIVINITGASYILDAEISIDEDSYTATIRPYCEDTVGNLVENVWLSVYRREYNGSFTRIASGLDNLAEIFVTDPHPALDYARYRIVAVNDDTGQMNYADIPGYPVRCKSIILQWNEDWHDFDVNDVSEEDPVSWSGSLLKLPYNIDIQNRYSPDVALIEYIGRENPVSYYGTQHGESATWNVEIAKTDVETIYALRRLAKWMGDVYVREPSGTGYWANVSVAFNIKHNSLTIPVTLGVTKVEGGM